MEALRRDEFTAAEMSEVLDHLPAMIGYWDRDLRNRLANRAYLDWFGVDPASMRGMHIRDLLGPVIFERNLPYMRRALAGEEQLFERTLVDPTGRTRYSQASYIPHVLDGAVQGFFVLVTDISARVNAEAALASSLADNALLQERQRIAADLHDTVIQRLFLAGLGLSAIADDVPAEFRDAIERAIDSVDESVRQLRQSIAGLTRDIGAAGLTAEVEDCLASAAELLGCRPELLVDGPLDLVPADVRPDFVAVLREALTNAGKHSGAEHVRVALTTLGGEVRLQVIDDGVGLVDPQRSSGLANMRARAERHGGSFGFFANDPKGTVIDWRVPQTSAPDGGT